MCQFPYSESEKARVDRAYSGILDPLNTLRACQEFLYLLNVCEK